MAEKEIVIPKVWRSEWKMVLLTAILMISCYYLSRALPWSIIRGVIFQWGSYKLYLSLPLFWLLPAYTLGMILYRIYDVRYSISAQGIHSRTGRLSLNQVVTHVRYEDIRGLEIVQSLLDRIFDIGMIEISTSATGGVEIVLDGISSPEDVQEVLLAERDIRQALSQGKQREE